MSSLHRAVVELKESFKEISQFLKGDWKIRYLERFCQQMSMENIILTYFNLVNISRKDRPIAPTPTVLENLKSMILNESINQVTNEIKS